MYCDPLLTGHWFALLVLGLVASLPSLLPVKIGFKTSVLGAVRKPSDLPVRNSGIKFQFSLLIFGHTLGK